MTTDPMAQFQLAIADPTLVLLEGFHAVKHAFRFGAEIVTTVHSQERPVDVLLETAPDLSDLVTTASSVTADDFGSIFRHPHPTGFAAIARRPDPINLGTMDRTAPIVLLDGPRHLGNIGATIRIAAAGGAAGLVCVGDVDPWHPAALRGSAGLHFALPILSLPQFPDSDRPIVAFDPDGDDGSGYTPPTNAILAFGSERTGLSSAARAAASKQVAFPMTSGVSSINLAASVAIGLYMWRLSR